MPDKRFQITRADGRSSTQVICDLVKDCQPGRVFSYEELIAALSAGCPTCLSVQRLQGIVRAAGPKLGKLHKRALHNVRHTGYRLAPAVEHASLALDRQEKAGRQLKRGFEILRDTRLNEIKDEAARRAHEGQFLIVSALMHAAVSHERRIARIEGLISGSYGQTQQG